MVSFIHPTSDSSSESQESSPPSFTQGDEVLGNPKCSAASDPPVFADSPELSVRACFSGATVLLTGASDRSL